jgi:hypothetical protein
MQVAGTKAKRKWAKHPREWRIWSAAKRRCYNPNASNYARYGGRGIGMCDLWRSSYKAFIADMGPCPPGRSLDRIDNNKDYEPGNCRWATDVEQNRNRCDNRVIETIHGPMLLCEAVDISGLGMGTLRSRLARGCPVDLLLLPPLEHLRRSKTP